MTRAYRPQDDDMRIGKPQLHRANHPTSSARQLQHGLFQFEWRLYRDAELWVVSSERLDEGAKPEAHIWQFFVGSTPQCAAGLELIGQWFEDRANQFLKEVTAPWTPK